MKDVRKDGHLKWRGGGERGGWGGGGGGAGFGIASLYSFISPNFHLKLTARYVELLWLT